MRKISYIKQLRKYLVHTSTEVKSHETLSFQTIKNLNVCKLKQLSAYHQNSQAKKKKKNPSYVGTNKKIWGNNILKIVRLPNLSILSIQMLFCKCPGNRQFPWNSTALLSFTV